MTNILNAPIENARKTSSGEYIQGSSHTCHVLNHKTRNKIIIKAVCDLRKISNSFDSIACCGVSGMLVVPQIAELLDKHIVVVRKEGEQCYSEFRTEGVAPFRYIILDDLICSGGTVNHIRNTIQEEYARAKCIGLYCYLPKECSYRHDAEDAARFERVAGFPLLNL